MAVDSSAGGTPYSRAGLRRALGHFLLGKALAGCLTFVAFALIARRLEAQDYGKYTAMLAITELALGFSAFGIDVVIGRLLPEYRVCASGQVLARTALRLGLLQSASVLFAGLVVATLAEPLCRLLELGNAAGVLGIYAMVILVEGLGRIARDQMLGAFLQQFPAQLSQLLRTATIIALLSLDESPSLEKVAGWELIASGCGGVVALAALIAYLIRCRSRDQVAGWIPPDKRKTMRLARDSYLTSTLWLASSVHVFALVLAKFAGTEAAAIFGFARSLTDQVRRFLPADLFMGLLRPAMVARFVSGSDFSELHRHFQLVLKISIALLVPILVFFAGFGAIATDFLSKGRLNAATPVVLLLLATLVPASNHRIADTMATIVHQAQLGIRAGIPLLALPPLAAALLYLVPEAGALFVAATMLCGEVAYNVLIARGFSLVGLRYGFDWPGLSRIALVAVLSAAMIVATPLDNLPPTPLGLAAGGVVSVIATLFAFWWIAPFSADEIGWLRGLRGQSATELPTAVGKGESL